MSKKPVRVAVTGAAGQIGYALLFRIASGEMLGKDQPVILQLLEIPDEKAQKALKGVMMELDDCAFPLLAGMEAHGDPMTAFKDADYALLVGSRPRGPGMERAELLAVNGADLHGAGQGAQRGRQPQRQGAGGRQPGQHQRLHRDEERARPAAQELHRHAAPGPQPRRQPAGRQDRQAGGRHREAHRLGQPLADDVRRLPLRHHRRRERRQDDQRPGMERQHLPADRRQARRRHHRGARPVVGRLGRQRRHRPHARLGARHQRQVGDDGHPVGRPVRHPEGHHVRLPGHLRERRIQAGRGPGRSTPSARSASTRRSRNCRTSRPASPTCSEPSRPHARLESRSSIAATRTSARGRRANCSPACRWPRRPRWSTSAAAPAIRPSCWCSASTARPSSASTTPSRCWSSARERLPQARFELERHRQLGAASCGPT